MNDYAKQTTTKQKTLVQEYCMLQLTELTHTITQNNLRNTALFF